MLSRPLVVELENMKLPFDDTRTPAAALVSAALPSIPPERAT
jgi:hypothetical protein